MSSSVLFVCLGNICRSPLAEAALRGEADRQSLNLVVDSAGTGDWHVGKPPDPRAVAVARKNGVDITQLRSRQVSAGDFRKFDHIVALDAENLANLERIRPKDSLARLSLLLDHVEGREGEAVADPYHGGEDHFEITWRDVVAGAKGFVSKFSNDR